MQYSWPLLVVGVAVIAWSRLGGTPGLGVVGLILIAVAVGIRLRALRARDQADSAGRAGGDTSAGGPEPD